jgi:hypothetical protein
MAGSEKSGADARWRVFVSHTAELREFPRAGSYGTPWSGRSLRAGTSSWTWLISLRRACCLPSCALSG